MNEQLRLELVGVALTEQHIETIEAALCFVPTSQRAGYLKGIADRLRPIREIRASDVSHAVSAVLVGLKRCGVCEDNARRQRPHGWAALDRR
jgi:hypothetical protein